MSFFRGHEAGGQAKRREAAFEHWRAEVLREASNQASHSRVKARVLANHDLCSDPQLLAMVRNLIAEREGYFHRSQTTPPLHSLRSATSQPTRIDEPHRPPPPAPPQKSPRDDAVDQLKTLNRQFHEYVVCLAEVPARAALDAILAIGGRYPDLIDITKTGDYTATLQRLTDRVHSLESQIEKATEHAVSSARHGDHEAAAQALRRLASVRAVYPRLLPNARLDQIRDQIANASERHDHRLAAKKLLDRERAVATEIKQIASVIHRFHRAAHAVPNDVEEYARAEADYHRAVAAVRSHEGEWLAGLILELVGLLNEMHDAPDRAPAQVDHFLASVRAALARLRREISDEKHLDQGGPPPP